MTDRDGAVVADRCNNLVLRNTSAHILSKGRRLQIVWVGGEAIYAATCDCSLDPVQATSVPMRLSKTMEVETGKSKGV